MNTAALLTIAIPTWNRANYLRQLLNQIQRQRVDLSEHLIELLVCDNHSDDDTPAVVDEAASSGHVIRYIRHAENIGSDCNIAACFNLAVGRYVWIMGDDDLPIDGTIPWLIEILSRNDYALLYLRPFGFDQDFRAEQPRLAGKDIDMTAVGTFLGKVGAQLNLISAMIVNKSLIWRVDATQFCGSNLVHVEIYLTAATHLSRFLYSTRYRVAYKRNNFGPYDFSKVFVENLGQILDRHAGFHLPQTAVDKMQRTMLMQYFPQYVLKMRWGRDNGRRRNHAMFRGRFRKYWTYWVFVEPIFALPRPLATIWGLLATVAGRSASGDLMRGIAFIYHKTSHRLKQRAKLSQI